MNTCCCCCCVASVVSDSVRPHRWQPIRLHRPWDSPGKNTGVGCHFRLQCKKVKSESEVAQSCLTLCDTMNCTTPDGATSLSLFTFMHWRRKWQPTPVFLPGESQGRWSLVGCRLWGRTESDTSPGGGHGKPLQYSCLENPMDRGAWCGISVHVFRIVFSQGV